MEFYVKNSKENQFRLIRHLKLKEFNFKILNPKGRLIEFKQYLMNLILNSQKLINSFACILSLWGMQQTKASNSINKLREKRNYASTHCCCLREARK